MKKWILFFGLWILLFCGCSRHSELVIEGIIEENNNEMISIHYPKIGIKKLDSQIETYILKQKESFHQYMLTKSMENDQELNIDYQYQEIGKRYLNITLTTFFTSSTMAHPSKEVKTFVFDKQKNRFLMLSDIASINVGRVKMNILTLHPDCIFPHELDKVFENTDTLKFTFARDSITLYFNPYEIASGNCGIIKYKFPFTDFKIELQDDQIKNTFEYHPIHKELSISKPTIALTFDDGPSKYTKEIVTLLNKYDANATFFILGTKVKNYHDTLTYVLENGNEIGNHSYNHKKLTRLNSDELQEQIDLTNQVVKETLDYEIRFLRPTYGAVTKKLKKETDMEIVLWNVDTLDWKLKNSKKIYEKVIRDVGDRKIILMHDIYKSTLEALKLILPELKNRGYQIVTVSDLKDIEKKRNEKIQ